MRSRERSKAFTLVELIVSLAITSVIAVFVFSFATSLAKLWRNTESGVETELDAQIALDVIASDLESAIFREGTNDNGNPRKMFAVSAVAKESEDAVKYDFSGRWEQISKSARPEGDHFSPEAHQYGWAGSWLRFFTSSPSFNAVGYQLIRRKAFGDSQRRRYLLHRTLVRHDNTLVGGLDIVEGVFADGNTGNAIESPRLDSILLEDVIDFGVRLYVFDDAAPVQEGVPEGLRLIFPATVLGAVDETDTEHIATDLSGSISSQRYPEVVEIFVRVLDDVGSELLHRLEEGDADLVYSDIVESHARLYRRTVRMPGREPEL